jgi:hypothetical protein
VGKERKIEMEGKRERKKKDRISEREEGRE